MKCVIYGFKEYICAQVLMDFPSTRLEASQRAWEAQKVVNDQIKNTLFIHCPHPTIYPPTNPSSSTPPLKIHNLTHEKITEHQLKGLCYNYDEKYFPRHKCKEEKIFISIWENILDDKAKVVRKIVSWRNKLKKMKK
jgi:hypothetical protein